MGWKPLVLLAFILAVTACNHRPDATSETQNGYILLAGSGNALRIAAAGNTLPLFVSSTDYQGVIRAAGDLQADLEKVTGSPVELVINPAEPETGASLPEELILVGTLGMSPSIDLLVRRNKLDPSAIRGKWESSVLRRANSLTHNHFYMMGSPGLADGNQ